jgi:hypothetical protein
MNGGKTNLTSTSLYTYLEKFYLQQLSKKYDDRLECRPY